MIAIGSNHTGYKLKEEIKKYLDEKKIKYKDYGVKQNEVIDYPEIAKRVSLAVSNKECDSGILISKTGLGMSIVANKFKGIKSVPCYDEYTAKYAKQYHNSNIIALGEADLSVSTAICILRMWLATEYEGTSNEELEQITQIEKENMK
ncbi:MAG: ribose 5-phosphate isomerase B [Clostridia bacterium]|nr:ribose 5-phosphate isomerase B [Clostridia bacterium]